VFQFTVPDKNALLDLLCSCCFAILLHHKQLRVLNNEVGRRVADLFFFV